MKTLGPRVPKTEAKTQLGALIRAIRLSRRETTMAFGERMGAFHSRVCRLESGKDRPLFLDLVRIATLAPSRELRALVVQELRKQVRSEAMRAVLAEVGE